MNYLEYLSPEQLNHAIEYFSASVTVTPLGAGLAASPTFTIGDADFLVCDMTGAARDPANPSALFVNPAITLDIRDQGAGRNLFDRAQDWVAKVGIGQDPYVFPMPYMVKMNSVVTVNLANLDPAQAYDVRVSFGGFKIFPHARKL